MQKLLLYISFFFTCSVFAQNYPIELINSWNYKGVDAVIRSSSERKIPPPFAKIVLTENGVAKIKLINSNSYTDRVWLFDELSNSVVISDMQGLLVVKLELVGITETEFKYTIDNVIYLMTPSHE